jgi:hypothetical protein
MMAVPLCSLQGLHVHHPRLCSLQLLYDEQPFVPNQDEINLPDIFGQDDNPDDDTIWQGLQTSDGEDNTNIDMNYYQNFMNYDMNNDENINNQNFLIKPHQRDDFFRII